MNDEMFINGHPSQKDPDLKSSEMQKNSLT